MSILKLETAAEATGGSMKAGIRHAGKPIFRGNLLKQTGLKIHPDTANPPMESPSDPREFLSPVRRPDTHAGT